MHEKIGLSGGDGLWILGRPCILGGRGPEGLRLLYKLVGSHFFL